ncbi:MAG: DUF3224 domain-containing protein [Sandaracinaceae bacterium]|nr:DUF3224 domain-containing protein [Sandaracinaceae bacterium]
MTTPAFPCEARGSFDVKLTPSPPYDTEHGMSLGHLTVDKRFHGPLEAVGLVHMISARSSARPSAAYVAVERIVGTLEGREGGFVVTHVGVMDRGAASLEIRIVADSGFGALAGIAGTMAIDIVEGQHFYTLRYALPDPSPPA